MKRHDAFVSAVEPATVTATPARPAPTHENVAAKWRDNLGMGIGVFCVLVSGFFIAQVIGGKFGIVRNFWSDLDGTLTWVAFSFLAGIHAFGWLMIWRSSLDEREQQGILDQADAAIKDRDDYIDTLESSVTEYRSLYENAVRDLAESRAALHQAMGRNSDRYRAPEDELVSSSVERDAQFLLQLMYSGQPAGWQVVTKTYNDWNRKKWEAARDLLEAAGVVRTVGNQTKPSEVTLQAAVSKLGAYCHSEWDS